LPYTFSVRIPKNLSISHIIINGVVSKSLLNILEDPYHCMSMVSIRKVYKLTYYAYCEDNVKIGHNEVI